MNDDIDPNPELPFTFPDPANVARQRAEEFRRLSPDERWEQIASVAELGLSMVRSSPRRAEIEKRWAAQEAEWREIQKKLFEQHGSIPDGY